MKSSISGCKYVFFKSTSTNGVLSSLIYLALVFNILYIPIRGIYGFNDDYPYLGLLKLSGDSLYSGFRTLEGNVFDPGRPILHLLMVIQYKFIDGIDQLYFLRIITCIFLTLTCYVIYFQTRNISKSKTLSFTISIVPLILPYFLFVGMLTTLLPVALLITIGVFFGFRLSNNERIDLILILKIFLLEATIVFTYQGIVYIIMLPALIRFLSSKKSRDLFMIFVFWIVGSFVLVLNWIYIKLQFGESRLSGSIDFSDKLYIFGSSFLPKITALQIDMLSDAVGLVVGSSVFIGHLCLQFFYFRKEYLGFINGRIPKIFSRIIYILLSVSLIPLTTIWLWGIPESSKGYRLVWVPSLLFVTASIFYLHQFLSNAGRKILAVFSLGMILTWSNWVHSSTVVPNIVEWHSAKCASSTVALHIDAKIPSDLIEVQLLDGKSPFVDEFQTQSMDFPNPQKFLPWFANNSSRAKDSSSYLNSPWEINVGKISSELSGQLWGLEFQKCQLR